MKHPSYKAWALASLLLLLALAGGSMLFTVRNLRLGALDQSIVDRLAATRLLMDRAVLEQSRNMDVQLRALVGEGAIGELLRRRDTARLQVLASELSSSSKGGRVAFAVFADDGHNVLLGIDGDGVKATRRDDFSAAPDQWAESAITRFYLAPWGEPMLKVVLPVKVGGATVGFAEATREIRQVLESQGAGLALRQFFVVDKSMVDRAEWQKSQQDSAVAKMSWDGLGKWLLLGNFQPDIVEALGSLLRAPTENDLKIVEWSGSVFRGGMLDLAFLGSKRIGKVVALQDVTAQLVETKRALWWCTLGASGFAVLMVVHLLLSFRPVERRLLGAQRRLVESKNQLEVELERRTLQMKAVNSRLEKEIDVRNRAEQKLIRNQMFLLTVLDSLAYPFIVVDVRDFGIKLANKAALRLATASGGVTSCFALIYGCEHPCVGKEMPCVLRAIHRFKQPVRVEHRRQDADGKTSVFEVYAYPISNGEGDVEQIIEYFIDITERKRAEDALSESERNYRELVETANSIVLRWDPQGTIRFINGFGAKFFGYTKTELCGRLLQGSIVPGACRDGGGMLAAIDKMLRRPEDYQNVEGEYVRKDGERVWLSWSNKAILDAQGNVVEILSFGNDITQRRRAIAALRDSEERFRNIYENSPVMMLSLDVDGRIISSNRRWSEETGYATQEGSEGRLLKSLLTPESARRVMGECFPKLWVQGALKDIAFELVRKNGTLLDMLMDCSVTTEPTGKQLCLGVIQNVSERKRTEQEMQLAASVFENSIEGIMITDDRGRILRTNKAFSVVTGYSAEEALGRNPAFLASGRHEPIFFQGMWAALRTNGYWQGEIWNRRKQGEIYPEWLGISTVFDENRQPIYFVGVFTDITDQKLSEQRIYHLAHFDALTDLPNRVLFRDRLDQALVLAKRGGYPLLMLYLDLDRFKPINDSFGHMVGDLLLQQVGGRLRNCVRESDTVARMGGDEFTVILGPGHSAGNQDAVTSGSRVARAILDALGAPFDLEGHEVFISASIGIVVYPQDGDNAAELVKNADTAMYHAKAKGRNNLMFYEAHMNATAADRLLIENSLRRALERAEFELYFQPSINIREGRIDALEALIRWRHPDLGMIPPDQFISLAEETGLIVPIGAWVLREAARQAALWHAAGFTNLRVAVNLSLRQFRHRDLINVIRQAVHESGLEASVLALEITESAFMEDEEETIARLGELNAMGIQILIDDFGTGYSSLARLRTLPIQVLKIDRSFVRDITTDPNDASIIAAIIAMAHNLQLKVIAEGVETASQLKFLKAHDCEEVQGYLFSKPVRAEDVLELLRRRVVEPA